MDWHFDCSFALALMTAFATPVRDSIERLFFARGKLESTEYWVPKLMKLHDENIARLQKEMDQLQNEKILLESMNVSSSLNPSMKKNWN